MFCVLKAEDVYYFFITMFTLDRNISSTGKITDKKIKSAD